MDGSGRGICPLRMECMLASFQYTVSAPMEQPLPILAVGILRIGSGFNESRNFSMLRMTELLV